LDQNIGDINQLNISIIESVSKRIKDKKWYIKIQRWGRCTRHDSVLFSQTSMYQPFSKTFHNLGFNK